MIPKSTTLTWGDHPLTIATGHLARQSSGAVTVSLGDTTVLVTAVIAKEADPEKDFFPLRVDYQERAYAAGKIPGGFFRREGRPSEREILIARLIDRPLRPLFPKGYSKDVHIIATLLALDPEIEPDVPAMIGASAALALAGAPISAHMGAARVGYAEGNFMLNPQQTDLKKSDLDLVVAGTHDSVLMVESEAKVLSEEVMLEAVLFGQEHFKPVITAIQELANQAGKPIEVWQEPELDAALQAEVERLAAESLSAAYATVDKTERQERLRVLRDQVITQAAPEEGQQAMARKILEKIEKHHVRDKILRGERRIDNRDTTTVRDITITPTFLPRVHGSTVFTRGETQALVVATLGTARDAMILDGPMGESKDTFMLHYNFPPYSVGEIGSLGNPKRREVGHGNLARRALKAVLPEQETFPYVVRVVSEITESNGSSSMATVCGASLALMDAGVPIKEPVAGVAMGLIKGPDSFAVLTDILGDEDHLGDMDFKVAGTAAGVTALQMDIKIAGITKEIMAQALAQAKAGRLHILQEMAQVLERPRQELSKYCPRIMNFKIDPEKIRDVIGKGGATIRTLTAETGATIDIQDDGSVSIFSQDSASAEKTKSRIEMLTAEVETNQIYDGKVVRITDFGAFVNLLPGKDGLLHISQISEERVQNVRDVLSEGQIVRVKVLEIDKQGRVKLTMK